MSDTCVVNYSSGWFVRGQQRLKQACLDVGYKGDFLLFNDENPLKCPPHSQVPYGFKPYAMKEAQKRGYRFILWCDSSVYPERPLDAVWALLREQGYMFLQCGHNCGTWCTDVALQVLGIDRELAFTLPQLVGGCQALDLQNELARKYLDRWFELANDGLSFHGDWTNEHGQVSKAPRVKGHRHDQVIGSLIAYQLGMTDFKGNWLIYDERGTVPRRPEMIFVVRSA
jgi:hypothetical protein